MSLPTTNTEGERILKMLEPLKFPCSVKEIAGKLSKPTQRTLASVKTLVAKGYLQRRAGSYGNRYTLTEMGKHYLRQDRLSR